MPPKTPKTTQNEHHAKHFLTVVSFGGSINYRALCGYTSNDPKEFTSIANPSAKGVNCPECLKRLGEAKVIVTKP